MNTARNFIYLYSIRSQNKRFFPTDSRICLVFVDATSYQGANASQPCKAIIIWVGPPQLPQEFQPEYKVFWAGPNSTLVKQFHIETFPYFVYLEAGKVLASSSTPGILPSLQVNRTLVKIGNQKQKQEPFTPQPHQVSEPAPEDELQSHSLIKAKYRKVNSFSLQTPVKQRQREDIEEKKRGNSQSVQKLRPLIPPKHGVRKNPLTHCTFRDWNSIMERKTQSLTKLPNINC